MAKFGSRTLKKGKTGSDVRELQTKLNSLGYSVGKVDGTFGTKTVAAVKKFQQDNNLAVDGIVGKNTYKKLAEELAKPKIVTTTTTNTKTSTSSKTATSKVTLTEGSAPTVAKDELRIGIQSKPITVTKVDEKNESSNNTSFVGDSDNSTTTKTTVDTKTTTTVDTTNTKFYYPPIEGDVTWDTERSGSPGKVTFKMRGDVPVSEGDIVSLTYGDTKVFVGYIFERSVDKSGLTSVTAYDQLKYFNNPDTYVLEKVKASDVLKRIADDYKMTTGTIEDTGIVIPSIVEDNQTLLDIVYNALDKTVAVSKKVYVFYDDYGKLTLKSLDSMRLNLMICEDTVGDYDYKASIDDETYNQIVLYYDNKDTKKREYFTASDKTTINQWGLLRKSESIDATDGAQKLADLYLAMYNKKTRKLSVKEAFGRPDVRAGTLVPVIMKVGELKLSNFMLVEKASHTWSNGKYFMNLELAGAGEFSV